MMGSPYRPRSPEKTIVLSVPLEFYRAGTEDVPGSSQQHGRAFHQRLLLIKSNGLQMGERVARILFGVER